MSTDLDIHFFKGSENIIESEAREDKEPLEKIKDAFGKVLDGKPHKKSGCKLLAYNR